MDRAIATRVLAPQTDLLLPRPRSAMAFDTTSSGETMCPNTASGASWPLFTPSMKGVSTHPGDTSNTDMPRPSTSYLRESR